MPGYRSIDAEIFIIKQSHVGRLSTEICMSQCINVIMTL